MSNRFFISTVMNGFACIFHLSMIRKKFMKIVVYFLQKKQKDNRVKICYNSLNMKAYIHMLKIELKQYKQSQ